MPCSQQPSPVSNLLADAPSVPQPGFCRWHLGTSMLCSAGDGHHLCAGRGVRCRARGDFGRVSSPPLKISFSQGGSISQHFYSPDDVPHFEAVRAFCCTCQRHWNDDRSVSRKGQVSLRRAC